MKRFLLSLAVLMTVLAAAAGCCNKSKGLEPTTQNPTACLTDPAKIAMVTTLEELDPDRLYAMDYTADYKLDEMLDADVSSMDRLIEFVAKNLFDVIPEGFNPMGHDSGCSAFAVEDKESGDKIMGRNYDFCHVENGEEVPITALMVKTAPANGKKAISLVDSYWIGLHKGFYKDGQSDLSMLMATPYAILDGMNEDGFAIGVLHLVGKGAVQNDPEKKTLWCDIMMRGMLDKCSTVDEAIEFASKFNINMETPASGSDHFFIADASGDYAIIECTFKPGANTQEDVPDQFLPLKGPEFSYVTNFYVDPQLAEDDFLGGKSSHGMWRYEILKDRITVNVYKLTQEEAWDLLSAVSQSSNPEENTSHTQWSALYNLTQRTMDLSILQEFDKKFSFSL